MPIVRRRGSRLLHVLLYFAWILPGVLYGMWRSRGERFHCRQCGSYMGDVPRI